jgi:hypothetical protein
MYMKKLYELGARTGLNASEIKRIGGLGALGLLAVGLASLAACFKPQKTPVPAGEAKPQALLQDLVNTVKDSTAAAGSQDGGGDCGPYPGYPCGTRYYTVSRRDFNA